MLSSAAERMKFPASGLLPHCPDTGLLTFGMWHSGYEKPEQKCLSDQKYTTSNAEIYNTKRHPDVNEHPQSHRHVNMSI